MLANLEELQNFLGYKFKNSEFLKTALIHRSYASEQGIQFCNERMEFLGDSILSAVVSQYLFKKYSDENEGKLSQMKSQIVSANHLSTWARKLHLDKFVLISKSEELNCARQRNSLLCDSFESIVGAIYLDSDFISVSEFVVKFLTADAELKLSDYKSFLQELVQAKHQTLPEYRVIKQYGPDHDKTFEIAVFIRDKEFGFGKGSSKKEAEQMAAKSAVAKLKKDNL